MGPLFDNSALDASHSCGYREAYEALQDLFKTEINQLKSQLQSQEQKIEDQQQQLNRLKKEKFGRRSEGLPKEKTDKAELTAEQKAEKRKKSDEKRKASRAKRDKLPSRHFSVELPADQRECPSCNETMKSWKEPQQSVVYVYVPGHFEKRVYHREMVFCHCGNGIAKVPPPRRPFQGGQSFDAGLVADIVNRKCADSQPKHRIRKAYRRQNMAISESTIGRLWQEAGVHLRVVWQRMCELVSRAELVLADETPVKLTKHPQREQGKCKLSYMWAFLAPDLKLFVFVFNVSRSSQTPVEILGGSKGTLVVDGYYGYNKVTTPESRKRAGCNLHARRKFLELGNTFKNESVKVRSFYNRIYEVEHRAKENEIVGTPEHLELRKTVSAPIMAEFKEWLGTTKKQYPPKSSLVKAINYTENQWEALTRFLEDEKIPPDNNLSEQRMRHIALGRKNWLFIGSESAGSISAILHTLVLNCEAHGVNPQDYLTDLVMKTPGELKEKVDNYLPSTWKPPDGFVRGEYPLFSEEYRVTELLEPPG